MGIRTAKKLQKRKAKAKAAAKRKLRQKQTDIEPYHGRKYRKDELVPLFMQTEAAIHEAFVISHRSLTDHNVRTALIDLITLIRQGMYPPDRPPEATGPAEGFGGMLTWNIRHRWCEHFEDEPYPGRDTMIGVLRSILGSIETWGSPSPNSRGYLIYIGEFMDKVGIHTRECTLEELEEMGIDPDEL